MKKKKKGQSEMEDRLYYYAMDKEDPPVEIIRQRPMKLKLVSSKKLSKLSPEMSEIIDNGILDGEGNIYLKIDTQAPRDLIHYQIDNYLDRYGKKSKNRFRIDSLKEGFNLPENKNLHELAKERCNTKDNASYNKRVKAEYEKLKRAKKRVKKSFLLKEDKLLFP